MKKIKETSAVHGQSYLTWLFSHKLAYMWKRLWIYALGTFNFMMAENYRKTSLNHFGA